MQRAIALVVIASGCFAAAKRDHLLRRSAFDFDCATSELRYTEIDARTVDVEGCGRRGRYVEACDGDRHDTGTTCTWTLLDALAPTAQPMRVDGAPGSVP